jgi:hypothetical protein
MSSYMHGQAMKAAGIPTEILEDALAPEMPLATLQTDRGTANPNHPNRKISLEEQDQMLREVAATGSMGTVEAKYGVSRGYLREAMRRRFGSLEAMKSILLGLVTENAIVSQMVASEKMGEMSGPQAVFAGKMLVDTMEKVEKSIQNTPKTVNFAQLHQVGEALKQLRAIVDKKKDVEQKVDPLRPPTTGN